MKEVSSFFSYLASVRNSFPVMNGIFPSQYGIASGFTELGSEFGKVESSVLQPCGMGSHG